MNLLKSMFISAYMMAVMGIAVYGGWMLYRGAPSMAWFGVMLTVMPILTMFMRAMLLKNVARTSAHYPLVNLLGAAGVGLAAYSQYARGADGLALALALASWLAFLVYAYWFSVFGGRDSNSKLLVGQALPEFSVLDSGGRKIGSYYLTDKPAVIIFYRGNWCPFCMAQLKELAERYKEINAAGVRVALISPQPHTNTVEIAKKFRIELSFEFFTDEGNQAARKLGIEQKHGVPMGMQMMGYDSDSVMPTVIITDRNGRIIWTHETDNYRVRPDPDVYLGVLRQHGVLAAV